MADPDRRNRIFIRGLKKGADQALASSNVWAPVEAQILQRVSQEIVPTYEKAEKGDPDAKYRLWGMIANYSSIAIVGPTARRLLAEEVTVRGAANARRGKAEKAVREKEKQRKAVPSIAAAIRAVAKDRGTPLEKLLVTRISFIRDHIIGSVNMILAEKKLPLATEPDIVFAIKEMKGGGL